MAIDPKTMATYSAHSLPFSINDSHSLPLLLPPISILALILILTPIYLIYKDYLSYLHLGPGGTPSTFAGYLRICFLRLFALSDPFAPPPVLSTLHPATGFLSTTTLPYRRGPRPEVRGIAPQRQMTQKGIQTYPDLAAGIHALATHQQNRLRLGTSCFEKHSTGLFAQSPLRRTCDGEVCHAHPSDGSLHLSLHPVDVAVLLEHGWGQRHPLAKGGWLSRFVPIDFVMVYAPRDDEELGVVLEIVRAAAKWVGGRTAVRARALSLELEDQQQLKLKQRGSGTSASSLTSASAQGSPALPSSARFESLVDRLFGEDGGPASDRLSLKLDPCQ
ncbi:MAG: hypothetical protein M1819_000026 [Sarea resinae]|nr:MAG: hypothetical protein M1819_000026 [Sarea resinae]